MKTRQEFNFAILDILKEKYPEFSYLIKDIEGTCKTFPDQRFGQIICNYFCPDYRNSEVSDFTQEFMDKLFHIKFDPFFEESSKTYQRLSK